MVRGAAMLTSTPNQNFLDKTLITDTDQLCCYKKVLLLLTGSPTSFLSSLL